MTFSLDKKKPELQSGLNPLQGGVEETWFVASNQL